MTEYQSPTLGRITFVGRGGLSAVSYRVTALGGRLRITFEDRFITGMRRAAAFHEESSAFREYMADEAQLPMGAPR